MAAMTDAPTHSWEEAVAWLRGRPEHQELVLNCYFDDPIEKAADRFWRSEEWTATRRLLPSRAGLALDLGAGRGIAGYALAMDGWNVVGLEPNASALVGVAAIARLGSATGI